MKGNAQIESASLGVEDHGLLTSYLRLVQGGCCQGFGGYGLDGQPSERIDGAKRTPSVYCGWWIARILETVGVSDWKDLKGKYIRVDGEDFGKIDGIGHIVEDRWFYPAKEIAAMKANNP